jgi:hypothetical protein
MLSCNGSLERREAGSRGRIEFDVETPYGASRKRGAVSGKSSISCHPSGEGGAGVVESTAVSRLSRKPSATTALSVQGPLSSTSASEALDSSSPSRAIGSSTPCQKNWSTIEGNGRAYSDSRLSYRFALTCSGRQSRPSPLKLPPQLRPSCPGLDPPL